MIRLLTILFLLAVLKSGEAWAGLIMMGGLGGSAGTLTKDSSAMVSKGLNYSFHLSWNPNFSNKPWPIVLGVQLKQLKLNFTEDSINKRATYNLYGGHLGFVYSVSPTFLVQATGEYYSSAQISVLSSNDLLLNGRSYKYATFEEYTGGPASGARLQFSHDQIDGQFSARNRYRKGIGISVVQQSFDRENTQITTSDSDLSPSRTYTSSDVSYRLLLLNIDLFIGLTF